jgi:hypothetical protein
VDNLWSKVRDLWNDPVWSKVIATGIITLLAFLIRLFWNQIKGLWKSIFRDKTQETHRSKYLENPIFNDLFINNNNRTMYQKLHGHKPEYIRLIDDLKKDGLIVLDKAGIPSLSAKGNKWIARIRKTI